MTAFPGRQLAAYADPSTILDRENRRFRLTWNGPQEIHAHRQVLDSVRPWRLLGEPGSLARRRSNQLRAAAKTRGFPGSMCHPLPNDEWETRSHSKFRLDPCHCGSDCAARGPRGQEVKADHHGARLAVLACGDSPRLLRAEKSKAKRAVMERSMVPPRWCRGAWRAPCSFTHAAARRALLSAFGLAREGVCWLSAIGRGVRCRAVARDSGAQPFAPIREPWKKVVRAKDPSGPGVDSNQAFPCSLNLGRADQPSHTTRNTSVVPLLVPSSAVNSKRGRPWAPKRPGCPCRRDRILPHQHRRMWLALSGDVRW
jgi:hypothetical protein